MKKLLLLGTVAALLSFAFVITSCSDNYGEDEGLIAKWYTTPADADSGKASSGLGYEFKDGTVSQIGTSVTSDYKVEGDAIITLEDNKEVGSMKFKVEDKKLTLSDPKDKSALVPGTYYKK